MRTAVLALGGNALARAGERPTITNQFRHARNSVAPIVQLAKDGWGIAIVHGNGPQVGDELVRNEVARNLVEPLPLGVLVANTAGWIGYMLQQSLQNALRFGQVQRDVVTLITQTLVDPYDPALTRPTKPIGHALSDELAAQLRETGIAIGRDGAGHWRRLAASPMPTGVVELELIRRLLGQNVIVVAGGGGGPPVYDHPLLGYEGLEAVVDKDRVAAILARQLSAEVLMILTDVDAVYADWGTPSARPLLRLTLEEVDELIAAGGVNEGGMKPKVQAAADFVRSGGGRAIVARLNDGPAALRGEAGTTIARS
ncbi:MAG TPA: carbamate kinase [Gemmatimonadales bacterium]|jgi:carbamate kinase|nr:carbamate kinase [Gemmatimonadales bacterium]